MSEINNIEVKKILELLISEADGTFDQREITPHKFLASIINSENNTQFASQFIDIINNYEKHKSPTSILVPISRVLFGAHVVEYFDRKRIYGSLVNLSVSTELTGYEKSALLDCINALGIKIERSDLVLLEGEAAVEYSFQWCVSLIRCGEYQELAQFLKKLRDENILQAAEIRQYFTFIHREVPENNGAKYASILRDFWHDAESGERDDRDIGIFTVIDTPTVIVVPQVKDRSGWLNA